MQKLQIFALGIAVSACAATPPRAATAPKAAAVQAPPSPARWLPPSGRQWHELHEDVLAKWQLDDGRFLFVGDGGGRRLGRANEVPEDAPTLAPKSLIGVLRGADQRFEFVARDGEVFLARDPLGPFEGRRPGPLAHDEVFSSFATGRVALMGISPQGRLMRSADGGTTWKTVSYGGPAEARGKAASIALDAKGNGLLLHLPQRLFVTHDDGATWSPIASPGIGASGVLRDGQGRLFFEGWNARALLEGDKLVTTDAKPAPMDTIFEAEKAEAVKQEKAHPEARTTILAGDRAVQFTAAYDGSDHEKLLHITVASAPLGERPSRGVVAPELSNPPDDDADKPEYGAISQHIASHGSDIVYLREGWSEDSRSMATTVVRSSDYGATWHVEERDLEGIIGGSAHVELVLGPKGWMYITELCTHRGERCSHSRIRPAGGVLAEAAAFEDELQPMGFAFDEARNRVYALGNHEGHIRVYVSPLTQIAFTPLDTIDADKEAWGAITVDPRGTLRIMLYENGQWELHRRSAEGQVAPVLYLPLGRESVHLWGLRGVLLGGPGRGAWETADGGETWAQVGWNGYGECGEAGCAFSNGAQRVGWDLPAAVAVEKVSATPDRVPQNAPSEPAPATPQVELTCQPSGPATPIAHLPSPEMVDGISKFRWAQKMEYRDGKSSVVFATDASMREVTLLPPSRGAPELWPRMSPSDSARDIENGAIAVRPKAAGGRTKNGKSGLADAAWWSFETGRVSRGTVTARDNYFSAQIVEGGLLFRDRDTDPVTFLHDGGRSETLAMPSIDIGASDVVRDGKRWWLADKSRGTMTLHWSDDGGKRWDSKGWALTSWGNADHRRAPGWNRQLGFALFEKKPAILSPDDPMWLAGVDSVVPNDPPAPMEVDTSAVATPCDARAQKIRAVSKVAISERRVRMRLELPASQGATDSAIRFEETERITHLTTAGRSTPGAAVCTSAYVLSRKESEEVFLFPEAHGWTGWYFVVLSNNYGASDATYKPVAQPLKCEAKREKK